ncbi:MAG TPA: hypothetical protein VM389_01290 [Phycisphaerae bacterium]|nr:hypothetical protein [Phycisphaerae bacterium]
MKAVFLIAFFAWFVLLPFGGCQSGAGVGDAGADGDSDADSDSDTGAVDDACPGDWTWEKQALGAAYLSGVWGRGSDDLWAFGSDTFVHFDGQAWSPVVLDGWQDVAAVDGEFDGSVWALAGSWLLRGDGLEFEPAAAVLESPFGGEGRDLWAGEDGVYVTGSVMLTSESPASVFLRRWDGTAFDTLVDPEVPDALQGQPVAIWGSGDVVFVVGSGGLALQVSGSVVEQLETGTTEDLVDVFGMDETDVYAAGSNGTVLHFDGVAWSPVEVPGLDGRTVHAVHATPSGEVFLAASERWWMDEPAVLDQEIWATAALFALEGGDFVELQPGFDGDPLGLWWDDGLLYVAGTRQGPHLEIQGQDGPLYHTDYIGNVDALAVNANGDLCAVDFHDIKQRVDGQWRWLSTSHDEDPTDVVAGADGTFWITAYNFESDRPALWRVDGEALEPAPGLEMADAHLVAVAVDRETGEVWASGLSGDMNTEDFAALPGLVLVLRDDGWHDVSPPDVESFIFGISATGGRAFVSCSDGLLAFGDGEWTVILPENDPEFGYSAAFGEDDAYFGGHGGLFHWDGDQLAAVPGAEGVRVFDMALDPGGVLWVAGDLGLDPEADAVVLLRLGSGGWQTMIEDGGAMFMGAVAPGTTTAIAASTSSFYEGVCAAGP